MESDIINIKNIRFFVSNSYEETLPLFFSTQNIQDGLYKKNENYFLVLDNIPYSTNNNINSNQIETSEIQDKNYIFSIKKHFLYKIARKLKDKNITPDNPIFKTEVEKLLIEFFSCKLKDKTKNPERVVRFLLNTSYKNFYNYFINKIITLSYSLKSKGFELKEDNRFTILNDKSALILTNGVLRYICCFLLNIEEIPAIINYSS